MLKHDYFPLNAGKYWKYNRAQFKGYYHPDTMAIDINEFLPPTGDAANPLQRTVVIVPDTCYPCATIVEQNGNYVCPPDWDYWCNSFYQMEWRLEKPNNSGWIGESGGMQIGWFGDKAKSSISFPPDPELPLNIEDYKTAITGVTDGFAFNRVTNLVEPISFPWKFRNLGKGTGPNETWWWPNYPWQLRTALEERPDTFGDGNYVYNYLWAKNVGPIMLWWGLRDKNNMVAGDLWMIAEHGNNLGKEN